MSRQVVRAIASRSRESAGPRPRSSGGQAARTAAAVLHYGRGLDALPTVEDLVADPEVASVLVVDSCSPGSAWAELVAALPSGVEALGLSVNGGYAVGMNAALDHILRDPSVGRVLLVTHEVRLEPGAVGRLVEAMEAIPQAVMSGPLLGRLEAPERVWSGGGRLHPVTWRVSHVVEPPLIDDWPRDAPPHEVEWLDGACVLVEASPLRSGWRFDPGFFMYYEENDLQQQLRRAGWSLVMVPAARAWQAPGSQDEALVWANWLRFVRRNGGPVRYALGLAGSLVHAVRLVHPSVARRARARARLRGTALHLRRSGRGPATAG